MSITTEQRARVSVQVGDQAITFETGHLAKQADGAVVVSLRRDDGARGNGRGGRRRAKARTSSR